jgi:hypothetical protein
MNSEMSGKEASQPSLTKKTNAPKQAWSKEKPVTAGLARLNLLDNSHESRRLTGKSEYYGMAVCYLDQDNFTSVLKLTLQRVYAYYSLHHSVRKHHSLSSASWAWLRPRTLQGYLLLTFTVTRPILSFYEPMHHYFSRDHALY